MVVIQILKSISANLLEQWATHWRDLVELEFVPVRRSKEAAAIMASEI